MYAKALKKFLCLVLVLALAFPLGITAYAEDSATLLGENLDNELVIDGDDEGSVIQTESPDQEESPDQNSGPDQEDNLDQDKNLDQEGDFDQEEEALEVVPAEVALFTGEPVELVIKSVEVLYGGPTQVLYRDEVYLGKTENGEDPDKYYTTRREFNLKDPRDFHLEFTISSDIAGADPEAFLETVNFTYGGYPLSSWGNGNNLRGNTPILELKSKDIGAVEGVYKVSATIRNLSPWATANSSGTNIPYVNYNAGGQGNFGSGQTADNRAWWQAGPAHTGTGLYELAAVTGEVKLAAKQVHIGPYDEHYSWIEMNEFAQSLISALTGRELPLSELDRRTMGLIASGYLAKQDGKYVKDEVNGVYVEVNIIGYGLTDNALPSNAGYNNYARYNAQWNVVVAKDFETVDDYLKVGGGKDQMNTNPKALMDKYENMQPEDIDFVSVYYQNNVHSDEVTGTETMIKLIDDLIDGGSSGKEIPYKTFGYDDINFKYRVPSSSGIQGTTHDVKDGYNGRFKDDTSRQDVTFDTGEALEKFIFVSTLCSNPDGKAAMRRMNRYGLDMNRDAVFSTQPETISLTKDIAKWDPLVLNEWHGYVTNMLIEPCTAPHDPTFEYDLMLTNMLQLAYESGMAITGSTGFSTFHVPWDHQAGGAWDDGGTIYAPMFSLLYGTLGYTVEVPFSNSDAFEAGNVLNYAMVNSLLHGETAYYSGNALNGQLDDVDGETRDSHQVDVRYDSMRKSSVMNKLEFKLRGIENIDSMAADKYFIDRRNNKDVVVGRPRHDDGNGGTLPYFSDYIIIPTDADNQYNVAEAIKALNHTMERGAKVSVTTEDVTYQGITYPADTYVYDMKQAHRNFIAEVMGKGYDATGFASMYADIYCNYPDVRGFTSVEVWKKLNDGTDVFAGALKTINGSITKYADIKGAAEDYVVFKSNSTDAVRFVNLLLSGKSSGPSFSEKGEVWMLRKNLTGVENGEVGTMSDYVIKASDLAKINNLEDNADLGLKGCHIEGKYINELPKEAVRLVEPIISTNSTRNDATTGGNIFWALDDYLGFNMAGYNGSSASSVRSGANVVLMNNATASGSLLSTIKNNKLGLIMVQSAATLTDANFGTGSGAPTASTFSDIALKGTYNVDDSLFTANYANTDTLYARGNYFTGNIPESAKILFRSLVNGEDAFIGGWQNTGGAKTVFGDRTTMFSTILKGGGIEGKPVQSLNIGMNLFNRSHYQKHYPLLATAIYAGAAGILDDQTAPVINGVDIQDSSIVVDASDADSGVALYALYRWDAAANDYVFVIEQESERFTSIPDSDRFKVVVTDYAGNQAVFEEFAYPTVSIRTAENTVKGTPVDFIISIANVEELMNITVVFEVDGDELRGTGVTAMNGLHEMDPIIWKQITGTNLWEGTLTLVVDEISKGITIQDKLDILKVTYDNLQEVGSTASMRIKYVQVAVWDEDTATSVAVENIINPNSATTTIGQWYSKYDLNKDGKVDGLDLAIAQRYYRAAEGDPDWEIKKIADVNGDGIVDLGDIMEIYINFTR